MDGFFRDHPLSLGEQSGDLLIHVANHEPSTDDIDLHTARIRQEKSVHPAVIVAIGGGSSMDVGKAVANLLTNGGRAEAYQGWDLVAKPGIYKIGIPTLSGTGAETSRTCVMLNRQKNLKLGMNSEHTIFDALILDPDLTVTVPRHQYFYTGVDSYIHCIESLHGRHRHALADAFSRQCLNLCQEVFLSDDMMSPHGREQLMVASYLGGCAIANSYVGVVHPLSAGLSIVLDLPHCLANCVVMDKMDAFYPEETAFFQRMCRKQGIEIPQGVCAGLDDEAFHRLYLSSIIHEKPLINALGPDYRDVLTEEKVGALFRRM